MRGGQITWRLGATEQLLLFLLTLQDTATPPFGGISKKSISMLPFIMLFFLLKQGMIFFYDVMAPFSSLPSGSIISFWEDDPGDRWFPFSKPISMCFSLQKFLDWISLLFVKRVPCSFGLAGWELMHWTPNIIEKSIHKYYSTGNGVIAWSRQKKRLPIWSTVFLLLYFSGYVWNLAKPISGISSFLISGLSY